MKRLLLCALLAPTILLSLYLAPTRTDIPDRDASLIERLDWMSGRWVIETAPMGEVEAESESNKGEYIEETWSPAREDAMVGCLRWSRSGGVWLYELMTIEADEEHGLVFRLCHFSRNLVGWDSEKDGPLTYPLLDVGDDYAIFENPDRDEPRRFVYRRAGDKLTIRIEDPEGIDEHPFTFTLAAGQ